MVEAVARDFDLGDAPVSASETATVAPTPQTGEKLDLVAALKTLVTLADRLRESDQDLPKERKL